MTGEPMLEVNIYLPASDHPLLRLLPGFEDLDLQNEVLYGDTPCTGLVDAPRAFSMHLRGATEDKCPMKSSQIDGEMCMRHDTGRLVAMLTKHVDDLKLTGEPTVVKELLAEPHTVFGELKVEWYSFTDCGVRRIQDQIAKGVTLGQIAYASNPRSITRPLLAGATPEELC